MGDLDGLERYLDDAATAAEAAEQAALQEADVLYTKRHRDTGLPRYPLALDLDHNKVGLCTS